MTIKSKLKSIDKKIAKQKDKLAELYAEQITYEIMIERGKL